MKEKSVILNEVLEEIESIKKHITILDDFKQQVKILRDEIELLKQNGQIIEVPGGFTFKLGENTGKGRTVGSAINDHGEQVSSIRENAPYFNALKFKKKNIKMSSSQRNAFKKLLVEHGLKLFSENLFLFVDNLMQAEVMKILNNNETNE